MPTIPSLVVLALAASQAPAVPLPTPGATSAPAPAAAPSSARRLQAARTVGTAVEELEACCSGEIARAPFETQRRWASAVFRWLVLTECAPAAADLGPSAPFEAQLRRVNPAWVAAVGAHSGAWLERHAARLPPVGGDLTVNSTLRFFEIVCVLGVFEQELQRAADRRDAAVAAAERAFAASEKGVTADLAWARRKVEESHKAGKPFDFAVAFREQREALGRERQSIEARIKQIQEENASYQGEWLTKHGRLEYGTLEWHKQIGGYSKVMNEHNEQILALSEDLVKIQKRIDRLSGGLDARDAEDLELPPAARPMGQPAVPAPASTPGLEKP